MLPDFGQTDAVQRFSPNVEGVLLLLRFPPQSPLVPSMQFVEGVLALPFCF